ncbi:MAG: protease inhibitor I42 family protein [bacterium]|nr:protease inhibitor I42 family protein [bacterium]
MKRLSEKFNAIAVKKGELFMLDLDGNPSTGYMWDVKVTAGDATLMSRETIPTNPGKMVIGGGNVERTIFRAETDGEIEIDAKWRRPWETSTAPAKHAVFNISVK